MPIDFTGTTNVLLKAFSTDASVEIDDFIVTRIEKFIRNPLPPEIMTSLHQKVTLKRLFRRYQKEIIHSSYPSIQGTLTWSSKQLFARSPSPAMVQYG